LDKLKNNKVFLFLIGISLIALISGSLFMTIISKSDQALVSEYITNFMDSIYHNKLNYLSTLKNTLISNIIFLIIIWLLGVSIIGIPIISFMYFTKIFTLGFSISAFILKYKSKGLTFSLIYVFPSHIINILLYMLFSYYAIKMSQKMINSTIKGQNINIKKIFIKYTKIFLVILLGIIITGLYETYVIPFLINKLYFIIK